MIKGISIFLSKSVTGRTFGEKNMVEKSQKTLLSHANEF
jgi:hypothetical protein